MNNALTKEHFKTAQEIKDILENKYPSIHPNSEWINVFKVASAVKMHKEYIQIQLDELKEIQKNNPEIGLIIEGIIDRIRSILRNNDECFPTFKEGEE